MKGKSIIELRDVHTGEVERHVDHNLVTNGMNVFPGTAIYGTTELNSSSYYPLWKNWFSGLRLFENKLEEDVDNYIQKWDEPVTGYASNTANTTDQKRGMFNVSESGPLEDNSGVRLVWDFAQSQANGQISCISIVPNVLVTPNRDDYFFYGVRMLNGNGSVNLYIDTPRGNITNPSSSVDLKMIWYDSKKREAYFGGKANKENGTVKITKCIMETVNITPAASFDLKVLEVHEVEIEGWSSSIYSGIQYICTEDKIYILNLHLSDSKEKSSQYLICEINKNDYTTTTHTVNVPWPEDGRSTGDIRGRVGVGKGNTLYAKLSYGLYKIDVNNLNEFVLLSNDTNVVSNLAYATCLCSNDEIITLNYNTGVGYRQCTVDTKSGNITKKLYSGTVINNGDGHDRFFEMKKGLYLTVTGASSQERNGESMVYVTVCTAVDTRIIYTINNLATPVIKTADKTMKITYILTNE